jgi:hypothetical protein
MTVWWLTIYGAAGNTYSGLKERHVIAQGWPELGDLSILAKNFGNYWVNNRQQFENVIQFLAGYPYPNEALNPPASLLNLFDLLSIEACDLVVGVRAAAGAGDVMGICQIETNGWDSYRHDDEDVFDYAHTVGFPVKWIDWADLNAPPPNPPAMIPGIQRMGDAQAQNVLAAWRNYINIHPNRCPNI